MKEEINSELCDIVRCPHRGIYELGSLKFCNMHFEEILDFINKKEIKRR